MESDCDVADPLAAEWGVFVDHVGGRRRVVGDVGVLDHGDLRRRAVAVRITRHRTDQARIVADTVEVLAYVGPVDDQGAAVVCRRSKDGVHQQRRSVVAVRPERSSRSLTELGLIVSQHVGSRLTRRLVEVRPIAHVRTREVHALGLRNRQVVRVQQTIGSHHHRAAETRNGRRLLDDEVTLRLEDREEQHVRRTGSDLGQHRNHVRVALVHRREPRQRSATSLERIRERTRQALRVRITVMDRSS